LGSAEEAGMSSTQQVLAVGPPVSVKRPWRPPGHRHLHGSDFRWAIAFVVPYAAVFLAFIIYPFGYALWMASRPSLYADLIADRLYLPTLVNTLLFVGIGVNVKMFLALLLSGFFMRRRWWIRALLAVYILPWALAAAQVARAVRPGTNSRSTRAAARRGHGVERPHSSSRRSSPALASCASRRISIASLMT
jgi:hypothetical protein